MVKIANLWFGYGRCVIISALILAIYADTINSEHDALSYKIIEENNSCKCVVFRLDDVKDEELNHIQLEIMNFFIFRDLHLSLGLIMDSIGNDSLILNKVTKGKKKGYFELALHGWDHIDYTTLSKDEQKKSLYKANEKMQMLFGKKSDIFIPPYNVFNNTTIDSMKEIGMRVLSSSLENEYKYDGGRSIFTVGKNRTIDPLIYHIPYTTDFKIFEGNSQVKVPIDQVISDIGIKIEKFGYAIVILHPQSFIKLNKSGTFEGNIDEAQIAHTDIEDLEYLINSILQEGILISSFKNITKLY